jgi:hypothetical protein
MPESGVIAFASVSLESRPLISESTPEFQAKTARRNRQATVLPHPLQMPARQFHRSTIYWERSMCAEIQHKLVTRKTLLTAMRRID